MSGTSTLDKNRGYKASIQSVKNFGSEHFSNFLAKTNLTSYRKTPLYSTFNIFVGVQKHPNKANYQWNSADH